MICFEVRFTCYQYNSGAGDNGYYKKEETFATLEEAKVFADKILNVAMNEPYNINDKPVRSDESSIFAEEYLGYGGFVSKLLGIWKITEEKVS